MRLRLILHVVACLWPRHRDSGYSRGCSTKTLLAFAGLCQLPLQLASEQLKILFRKHETICTSLATSQPQTRTYKKPDTEREGGTEGAKEGRDSSTLHLPWKFADRSAADSVMPSRLHLAGVCPGFQPYLRLQLQRPLSLYWS